MTITSRPDRDDHEQHAGGRAEPLNMHTDVLLPGSPPQAQPLNMHTDIVVTKTASTVTITGAADGQGVVSVQLPAGVCGALKHKVGPVPALGTAAARADVGAAQVVYALSAHAKVTGHPSSALRITGPAKVEGIPHWVVLTISEQALTTLRTRRDAL